MWASAVGPDHTTWGVTDPVVVLAVAAVLAVAVAAVLAVGPVSSPSPRRGAVPPTVGV